MTPRVLQAVININLTIAPHSDHNAISATLGQLSIKPAGAWKLNTTLLHDAECHQCIVAAIRADLQETAEDQSPLQ